VPALLAGRPVRRQGRPLLPVQAAAVKVGDDRRGDDPRPAIVFAPRFAPVAPLRPEGAVAHERFRDQALELLPGDLHAREHRRRTEAEQRPARRRGPNPTGRAPFDRAPASLVWKAILIKYVIKNGPDMTHCFNMHF
jgi:hypothetical protein